ncbi:HNH endonuclease signature motif containing protein [Streptomyces hydrogenans]|uniref:HNH endonuclease signature motif containing protein n=1 Tax=Streptomyces hydrogenans TaxID=1873719 RepID=UPI0037FFE0A1
MREAVRYTRERLAEAASQCADIHEVMDFFGAQPYDKLRRYLLKRFAHYGIDISHFPHRRRGKQPPRPTAEDLRNAVEKSLSVSGALRLLDRPDSGQMRELFRRWTAEDGLVTAHFLGQAHQRGKSGPTRPAAEILVRHDGRRRTRTHLLRRALREVRAPEECAECGTGPEWLGDSITLEVDHVNGDWSDDRRENLRLLCPNCHAVTDTWCRGGRRVK